MAGIKQHHPLRKASEAIAEGRFFRKSLKIFKERFWLARRKLNLLQYPKIRRCCVPLSPTNQREILFIADSVESVHGLKGLLEKLISRDLDVDIVVAAPSNLLLSSDLYVSIEYVELYSLDYYLHLSCAKMWVVDPRIIMEANLHRKKEQILFNLFDDNLGAIPALNSESRSDADKCMRQANYIQEVLRLTPVVRFKSRRIKGDNIDPILSIVVAVYNGLPNIRECFSALEGQLADKSRFEILLIDDCSTDGSYELCLEYEARYSNIRVMRHKENYGSPALARNEGIDLARGEYIFFHDNDDYMGREAVSLMIKHLDNWNPDVLLVKLGETGNPKTPKSMFKKTQESTNAYMSEAVRTLGPWKAFNVNYLRSNNIRFPLDCSRDDSLFTFEALLRTERISIAADYDYYYWTYDRKRNNLGSDREHPWAQYNRIFTASQRMFWIYETYSDKSKEQQRILVKLLQSAGLWPLKELLRVNSGATSKDFDEVRSLVLPYLDNQVVLDKLMVRQRALYITLKETTDCETLRRVWKSYTDYDRVPFSQSKQ